MKEESIVSLAERAGLNAYSMKTKEELLISLKQMLDAALEFPASIYDK